MEPRRLVTRGLVVGGLIFAVGVVVLVVAVVRGWALVNEIANPPPKTAEEENPSPEAWPEPANADDDDGPAEPSEAGEATLLVSRALNLAKVRSAWTTEAKLSCIGRGCGSDDAEQTTIMVKPGMAVKWELDWRAGKSEAWTEHLASDLVAGRPDALDDVKLRFARAEDAEALGRPKHRVVEFWDPTRKRAGLWAVVGEGKAKIAALAWLGDDGATRWVLELDS